MKVNNIEQSDGKFAKDQKSKLKYFLNLAKYDVIPSAMAGSVASAFLVNSYSPNGIIDAMLLGGVTGTAFILAVNGVVTGVKASKETREKIRMQLDEKKEKEDIDKGNKKWKN